MNDLERDDILLDALGRGDFRDDDEVAEMLSIWHADLADLPPARFIPAPQRERRPFPRPLVIAIAATVLTFGGLTAAAATAEPGNPLWRITQIVNPDRAAQFESKQDAERLLAEAETAAKDRRVAEAMDLLSQARAKISTLDEPDRTVLTERLKRVLALLPGSAPSQQQPQPQTQPHASSTPAPGAQPTPTPGGPTPKPSRSPLLPPLLPSLLPSLPLLG